MIRPTLLLVAAFAWCSLVQAPRHAQGVTVQLTLAQFTGDPASATIQLNDDGGIITGLITVQPNPNIGDLRAVFLQVIDESILPGLSITGPDVTDFIIGNNDVTSVGNANVNGDGSPGPFDIGIAFGTPGLGADDIQSTAFFMNHASTDLALSMFDLTRWGLRMTSVGLDGGPREGSSKLNVVGIQLTGLEPPGNPTPSGDPDPTPSATAPIPEPGTAMFVLVTAVFATGWWRSRRRTLA